MYKVYVTFRPETGEIIGWIADHEPPQGPGHMESPTAAPVSGMRFYVKDGVVTPRPASPATFRDGRLENLPAPCEVIINSVSYPCNESSAEVRFTYEGQYSVTVRAFPYMDASFAASK